MPKSRYYFLIKGHVQGVFFRSNTRKQAEKLGLTGWVKNNPDGTVEAVAEGEEAALEKLAAWCRKGPSTARVDDVDINKKKYKEEFDSFSIRY